MESRGGGKTAGSISRIGSWEREAQGPFDFLEGHINIGKRVTEEGNCSGGDIPIRRCILLYMVGVVSVKEAGCGLKSLWVL